MSLKKAINDAVAANGGSISAHEAEKILAAHNVRGGYMTIVVDEEVGIEKNFFVDLVFDGDKVTGIKVEQDLGQFID